jgi:spermidine synthase
VKAAGWFTHINENVLERPTVRLIVDDARNYLLLGRGRYDVITADIIQPTHAGAGLLYSQEYFRLARAALNDGGMMVQWVGPRSETYYKLIARTFQTVFPETTVWVNGSLLIGSTRPQHITREALAGRFASPAVRASLADAGFPDVDRLLAQYSAGPDALRAFLGDGPILTDDRPRLEYFLSLPQHEGPVDLGGLTEAPRPK